MEANPTASSDLDQVDYKVVVVNYEGAQIVDVRGSMAYAAWYFRQREGQFTFDAYPQADRIEGHQLQFTNSDLSRTYVAIRFHKGRLCILGATAPAGPFSAIPKYFGRKRGPNPV